MKKVLLLFCSFVFCLVVKAETTTATDYAGGSGTSADPYQIATLAQLRLLSESSNDWDKSFILTADIDAADTKTWNSGYGFSAIGNSTNNFTGSFNGGFYAIDSLYFNIGEDTYFHKRGFFGCTKGASVKNISLTNCNIYIYYESGALIGYADSTSIEKCSVTGKIDGYIYSHYIGVIAGVAKNCTITQCYSNCSIIVGAGTCHYKGGIAGEISGTTTIENCFSANPIIKSNYYGGIVGLVSSTKAKVINCYFSGQIKVTSFAIVEANSGTVTNCYFDKTLNSGTCSDATGLSSAEFSDTSNFTNWDFDSTWKMVLVKSIDTVTRPYFPWSYDHLVTFNADETMGSITGPTAQGVNDSEDADTVIAVPIFSKFMEWQDPSGNTISTKDTLVITNVTQDTTLTAIFSPIYYNVSFSSDENGTISGETSQTVTYVSGTTEVTAIPNGGCVFIEWQDDKGHAVSTDNPLTVTKVICDTTFKAIFEKRYDDGLGSSNNPYQIATLEQLKTLSKSNSDWNYYFIQTADIDAADTKNWNISGTDTLGFSPIGNAINWFKGTFDGQNHTISNLFINTTIERVGIFGGLYGGTIKNFGLVDCDITGGDHVGSLAGTIGKSSIVSNCYASGSVSGASYVGGFMGNNGNSTVSNCFSNVTVTGSGSVISGFIGQTGNSSTVSYCYSAGSVSGSTTTGGFIANESNGGTTTSCYFDSETSGKTDSYATALTTTEFADASKFSNWDFTSTWKVLALVSTDSVMRPNLQWSYDHVVTFELGENGDSIIGANIQGIINDSSTLEVLAVANTGYHFSEWQNAEGNQYSTANPLTISNVTGDYTITAVFGIETYTVIFLDWDKTQLSKQTVEYGSAATAPSEPSRTGYAFTGWDVEFSSITSDLTVIAQYANSFTVKFTTDGNGTIKENAEQTVEYGASATKVEAIANDEYQFVKWQDENGNEVSTNNPFTLTNVTQDSTIIAVFERTTGVGSLSTVSNLDIYPNPTTGVVSINFGSITEKAKLSIYTITGEVVYSNPSFNGGTVDISALKQGIYIVNVCEGEKKSIVKLIKE